MAGKLASFSTAELVTELNRRFAEVEQARKTLLGSSDIGKTFTKNSSASKTAVERWSGWHEYKKKNPKAKPAEFFKTKKK
jgi:hypothetical protein